MTQREAADHPLPPLPPTSVSPVKENTRNGYSAVWGNRQEDGGDTASVNSLQRTPPQSSASIKRKAVPKSASLDQPDIQLQHAPLSPVNISPPRAGLRDPDTASIRQAAQDAYFGESPRSSGLPESPSIRLTDTTNLQYSKPRPSPSRGKARASYERSQSRGSSGSQPRIDENEEYNGEVQETESLQYHAFDDGPKKKSPNSSAQNAQNVSHNRGVSLGSGSSGSGSRLGVPQNGGISRPMSMMSLGPELRGRTLSPLSASGSDHGSPRNSMRDVSGHRKTSRPVSYVENLNNLPYAQQIAPGSAFNDGLAGLIGNAASRLDTKKTLEMYRANVKKTNEPAVQYEFAIFMINASQQVTPADGMSPLQLQQEAKQILQKLADRAYPFAQYYLGDGYFSGMFNKDKPDKGRAFELFAAASKHGHAEAGYRAALCYEFGWGTAKSYPKAVQFYRTAASKNHPGAATRLGLACIRGDMGLVGRDKYREGVKWLKRASESADAQYNAGPYELGLLHLTGFGDDIFKDEAYASQLLTHSAELGHAQASFLMGQAYENGQLGCPRDAALSVHFYTGAADKGHPEAMMALCAWFMVGAAPVLEKDEGEAFAWAKQAAETGFAKAEYAVGYFTEMGIGCRRDPLEANVWYVRAADQGNENAAQRLQIIRAAASGDPGIPMSKASAKTKELAGGGGVGRGEDGGGGGGGSGPGGGKEKKKFMGIF